jgi:hypothetical protein
LKDVRIDKKINTFEDQPAPDWVFEEIKNSCFDFLRRGGTAGAPDSQRA